MAKHRVSQLRIGFRLAVFVSLFLTACKCSPTPPGKPTQPCLRSIEITPLEVASGLDSAEALQTHLRQAFVGSPLFRDTCSDASQEPQVKVRLSIGLLETSEASAAEIRVLGHLQVTLQGSSTELEHFTEDTEAVGIVPFPDATKKHQLLLKTTFQLADDLVRSYLERQQMWNVDDQQLYNALKPDAGDSRLEAIQIMGQRQLRAAVPTLLRLLEDEDERVRDAALGALLRMKETQAVSVLTRSRAMRDSREMHKVIEAVALLGGPEAASYLAFVAENHDSESIRLEAQRALKRLGKSQ